MDYILRMQIHQSIYHLFCVLLTDCLTEAAISLTEVSDWPTRHVLQVNAKHIVICKFTAIVSHYMLVVKVFEPVNFLLQGFDLALVDALEWVH